MLDIAISKAFLTFQLNIALRLDSEILVLFGPSGAGKSLTMKMIAGLESPDQGQITISGRTLFDANCGINLPPQLRRVGYVPQRSGLFPHMTALENVSFPLRKGKSKTTTTNPRQKSLELLETFGLAHRAHARPAQLSGGEIQRVAFARALASDPAILLFDEPFTALDAPVRAELRREFKRFQRQIDVPAIFITHDIEEAAMLADRIAVLVDGTIRQVATSRIVLDRPADQQVARLVQAHNIYEGLVIQLPDQTIVRTEIGDLRIVGGHAEAGQPATIVIRPEVVRIVREDRDMSRLSGQNILAGTIREIIDHGPRTAVYVTAKRGEIEVSLSATATANLDLQPGKSVSLAFPPDQVHVIA